MVRGQNGDASQPLSFCPVRVIRISEASRPWTIFSSFPVVPESTNVEASRPGPPLAFFNSLIFLRELFFHSKYRAKPVEGFLLLPDGLDFFLCYSRLLTVFLRIGGSFFQRSDSFPLSL